MDPYQWVFESSVPNFCMVSGKKKTTVLMLCHVIETTLKHFLGGKLYVDKYPQNYGLSCKTKGM